MRILYKALFKLSIKFMLMKFTLFTMSTRLIRIHEDTLEKLAKHGKAGQSFNDVIEKILKELNN